MIQAEHLNSTSSLSHSDSSEPGTSQQHPLSRSVRVLALSFLLASSSACNEYWRSRGQPPSVAQLMERAQAHLGAQLKDRSDARPEVARISKKVEESMMAMFTDGGLKEDAVKKQLASIQNDFLELEGKVSIGSRAAFGELSSQLRGFVGQANRGGKVDYAALGLFTSRVIRFFGNEMMVPPPEFG